MHMLEKRRVSFEVGRMVDIKHRAYLFGIVRALACGPRRWYCCPATVTS